MREAFGVISFLLVFGITFPYAWDILKGRAQPARSTRILFFILMTTTLIVQSRDFTSWVLALTVGEVLSQLILLALSVKYGLGGLKRVDIASYIMFSFALTAYLITGETLVGLFLLCLTDVVAFIPTLVKNFRDPSTDTPLFYAIGAVAPTFSLFAASDYSDLNQVLVPAYLIIINILALVPLIFPPANRHKNTT